MNPGVWQSLHPNAGIGKMLYFDFMIRTANPFDAAAMLAIYAPFIRESGITQETGVPSVADFAARIEKGLAGFPWLVYEEAGVPVGYAYASRYRERAGYRWNVEVSVYLHPGYYGKGLARRLYDALFALLIIQGYINAYAVITLPNEQSIRFHTRYGFEYFATYKKVGFKLGSWHDVGWMQYAIQPAETSPAEPVPFSKLDQQLIDTSLHSSNSKWLSV